MSFLRYTLGMKIIQLTVDSALWYLVSMLLASYFYYHLGHVAAIVSGVHMGLAGLEIMKIVKERKSRKKQTPFNITAGYVETRHAPPKTSGRTLSEAVAATRKDKS